MREGEVATFCFERRRNSAAVPQTITWKRRVIQIGSQIGQDANVPITSQGQPVAGESWKRVNMKKSERSNKVNFTHL